MVFLDKVVWPTGLACFEGGLFVAAAPDLLYCKDTDGDGKADLREVVLTGFRTGNPNGVPNSLRWSLDSRIEGMPSTSGGKLQAVRWEKGGKDRKVDAVESRGRDFSYPSPQRKNAAGERRLAVRHVVRPMGPQVRVLQQFAAGDGNVRGPLRRPKSLPWPLRQRGLASGPTARAVYRTSPVEPWRILRTELRVGGTFTGPIEGGGTPAGYFTGACGVTIYTGNAWPEQYLGNSFTAEGSSNIVHRMAALEPNGVAFRGRRTEQKHEFIASDEVWFRPVQFAVGPDGNLYMADMYREVYEHPGAVPPSAKMHIDLSTGQRPGSDLADRAR